MNCNIKSIKKIMPIILVFSLVLAYMPKMVYGVDTNTKDYATPVETVINGYTVETFNIGGNNYVKLRDIAYILDGTESQFDVTWNSNLRAVNIITNHPYSADDKQLYSGNHILKPYKYSTDNTVIYLDGEEINPTSYLISNNNYFKLQDLGKLIGFGILYDEATKEIQLVTETNELNKYVEYDIDLPEDDHTIPATITIPMGDGPYPAVIMLHGTASNRHEVGGGYDKASQVLAEEYGIASIRFDFMGNGDSTASYRDYNYTSAVNDTHAILEYISTLPEIDSSNIGVMGWSQGGTIAMLTASKYPNEISSVVTWAGASDMSSAALDPDYEIAKEQGYVTKTFDWREPLDFGLQWYEEAINTNVLEEFEKFDGPVFAIGGSEDTSVLPEEAKKIVDASSNIASRYFIFDGLDHTFNVFTEPTYESLYEAIDLTASFFKDTLK